jgi:hypothetical protein
LPGGLDILTVNTGILDAFVIGFDHKFFGTDSQRSPKQVQPIPIIATLSLIPVAIFFSLVMDSI